ncbi:protein kinase, partial [Desulfobacterota bacterium AH_259_B03_O07]|nr:protein kinase [Desulfobacterota bacterium AH_259_B03_O07]
MDFNIRWKKIEEVGQGGQGKVFRVIDRQKFTNADNIKSAIENLERSSEERFRDKFGEAIIDFVRRYDPTNQGALKILHEPEVPSDSELAAERIRREIEAMKNLSHPNLLKILDVDDESKWYVSQYYSRGTLANNLNLFQGKILKALNAFSSLVEAVSLIHESNKIHRDIKPQNIFLDTSGNLILGDFGLVFFTDEEHSRISERYENVGSRDWMPPWGYGARIEDLRPSFDLFCLGKVLWSMISGRSFLRLWDFMDDEFNLELKFPENRFMRLVNNLLSRCVVRREENCIFKDAEMFL